MYGADISSIVAVISLILGIMAAVHAIMTKKEVSTAIGWVGLVIFSPILGAVIYLLFGINKIHRQAVGLLHNRGKAYKLTRKKQYTVKTTELTEIQQRLYFLSSTNVSRFTMTKYNSIELLAPATDAYMAMLAAIDNAKQTIFLETYIFDKKGIGEQFVKALAAAVGRGVKVKVLIDAVGARYSMPSVVRSLKKNGIRAAVFNGNIILGLRLPYANLRTHRKLLIVDGALAFTGGLNINNQYYNHNNGLTVFEDTHFALKGPIIDDLIQIFYEDWKFATGELLLGSDWQLEPLRAEKQNIFMRAVASGPDSDLESNYKILQGAFAIAKSEIWIATPYFLPGQEFINGLIMAARRGVKVNIILPQDNNLKLLAKAMFAELYSLVVHSNCKIWLTKGPFNHSKLAAVDSDWSFIGSSNLDARSFRLNFELDVEVLNSKFTSQLKKHLKTRLIDATLLTPAYMSKQSWLKRFSDRLIWLGSPYL